MGRLPPLARGLPGLEGLLEQVSDDPGPGQAQPLGRELFSDSFDRPDQVPGEPEVHIWGPIQRNEPTCTQEKLDLALRIVRDVAAGRPCNPAGPAVLRRIEG